ncbi:MAG: hypothetical protein KDD06_20735 [Phaeodactylibacter sp.]|nr:hypothetical protein [Phaeodactylibacter sp.]MCB9263543.1 hypothetical protein [Lewinellaceae bacterium]MCB9287580.1 hypothetical protein [Lewinellaceae bacterium]
MRRHFVYITIGIGMMLALSGCQKDIDVFEPAELTSGDISRFFEAAKTTPLSYSWEASKEQVLPVPGSGQIVIPPNVLAMQDGSPVAGVVQANLLEIHNKGSLIRNNAATASNSRLLESAGIVFLEVRKDGQLLRIAEGQNISLQLSTANYNPQLRLFSGNVSDANELEWTEINEQETSIRAAEFFNESSGEWEEGFEILTGKLGWLQCARYAENGPGNATACVRLPVGFSLQNTAAFVALQSFNTVIRMDESDEEGTYSICRSGLPTGVKAEIIVITESDDEGNYYFSRQPAIIMENLTINIVPEQVQLSDIMLALETL